MKGFLMFIAGLAVIGGLYLGWDQVNQHKGALPGPIKSLVDSLESSAGIPTEPLFQEPQGAPRAGTPSPARSGCPAFEIDMATLMSSIAPIGAAEKVAAINAVIKTAITSVEARGAVINVATGSVSHALHDSSLSLRVIEDSIRQATFTTTEGQSVANEVAAASDAMRQVNDELVARGMAGPTEWKQWADRGSVQLARLENQFRIADSCP
jgi:hypothetical protein